VTVRDIDRVTARTAASFVAGTLLSFVFAVFSEDPADYAFSSVISLALLLGATFGVRAVVRHRVERRGR